MTRFLITAAFAALAAPALAETKTIFECEMKPIPGTNAWQRVDPTCLGDNLVFLDRGKDAIVEDEDDGEDPVDPIDPEDPVDPVDPIYPEEPVEPEEPEETAEPVEEAAAVKPGHGFGDKKRPHSGPPGQA